jgi:hypothetical protein
MAQHAGRQGEWPIVKREPDAYVLVPDVYTRTDRGAAGPLRSGTSPGVGPSTRARPRAGGSDYGMDRVEPREMDPMGTSKKRNPSPSFDRSPLISTEPAPRTTKRGSGAGHD